MFVVFSNTKSVNNFELTLSLNYYEPYSFVSVNISCGLVVAVKGSKQKIEESVALQLRSIPFLVQTYCSVVGQATTVQYKACPAARRVYCILYIVQWSACILWGLEYLLDCTYWPTVTHHTAQRLQSTAARSMLTRLLFLICTSYMNLFSSQFYLN